MIENLKNFELISIWNFQLFMVDGHPMTVGKLIIGLIVFILGYILSRKASNAIHNRLLNRMDIDVSLRETFRSVIFYVFLVFTILFTLRLLSVPITIFAVLGGALAIGVGFGSQNIVNNFISGLIIMLERPIRVGDFVELEDLRGTVETIGARATLIKGARNTHYVVPNSSFLENNVMNWTLSDRVLRSEVTVGVAYGSPTRKVEELLRQAMAERNDILKQPEPIVLFTDFADNSLNFEIIYWSEAKTIMDLRKLASHLRFRIDELFEENNIVIAFPQRDVHLDTLKPLQVELTKTHN